MDDDDLLAYNHIINKFQQISKESKAFIIQSLLNEMIEIEADIQEYPSERITADLKDYYQMLQFKPSLKYPMNSHLIQKLHKKITKRFASEDIQVNDVKLKSFSLIILDYPNIVSITYLLIQILSQIVNTKHFDKKLIHFFNRDFLKAGIKDKQIWSSSLLKYISDFETLKVIEMKISDKRYDKIIELEFILFFYLFFDFLFPCYLEAKVDLNLDRINQIYFNDRNPYKMKEKFVTRIGMKYQQCIISNFLFSSLITRNDKLINLKLRIIDSYAFEVLSVHSNSNIEIEKIQKDTSPQLTLKDECLPLQSLTTISISSPTKSIKSQTWSMLYLKNILNLGSLYCLNLEFNSIDPILFDNLNILLIKNIQLEQVTLNLFWNIKYSNLRKILLNEQHFNTINKKFTLFSTVDYYHVDDTYIDLISLETLKADLNNFNVIDDEKIPKYLFNSFNKNLINLATILENKIWKLKSLQIRANLQYIQLYDCFNSALASFIYNIFRIIQNQLQNLQFETLELAFSNDLHRRIYKNFSSPLLGFDFTSLKVSNLIFNMQHINLILPFQNFPYENCQYIELRRLTYDDFTSLNSSLSKNKAKFQNLIELKVDVDYSIDFLGKDVYFFFEKCIPPTVDKLTFQARNEIYFYDLLVIIENLWKNRQCCNLRSKYGVSLYLSMANPENPVGCKTRMQLESCASYIIFNCNMMWSLSKANSSIMQIFKIKQEGRALSMVYAISNYLKKRSLSRREKQRTNYQSKSKICIMIVHMLYTEVRMNIRVIFS